MVKPENITAGRSGPDRPLFAERRTMLVHANVENGDDRITADGVKSNICRGQCRRDYSELRARAKKLFFYPNFGKFTVALAPCCFPTFSWGRAIVKMLKRAQLRLRLHPAETAPGSGAVKVMRGRRDVVTHCEIASYGFRGSVFLGWHTEVRARSRPSRLHGCF
jgi:hypothetical protein